MGPVTSTARPHQAVATRDRILAAAVDLTSRTGWAKVTMARLADEVGVSRQTVYNEIGTKNVLAEAMVQRELEAFLSVVGTAFDEHPDDLQAAVVAASRGVLDRAQDNPLLHAVASATHGADTELLPLLTTHAGSLLAVAKMVVGERVASYDVALGARDLDAAIDTVVRVVLSHVMQPSGPPAQTADDIGWVATRVLRG